MRVYDLYIPIGIACTPAIYLNDNDLRIRAYPLDWQMSYSLDTIIHLFKTSFNDFFREITEDSLNKGNGENRQVIDTKNSIISLHHFPLNKNLNEGQKHFIETMTRRYEILLKQIKSSEKIALVSNRNDNIEKLKSFLIEFSSIFPHLRIDYINIRTNNNMLPEELKKEEYIISDNLKIEEYIFNNELNTITKEIYDHNGNSKIWNFILKDFYLTGKENYIPEPFKNLNTKTVIYGAQKRARQLVTKLSRYNINLEGIAVSDLNINIKKIEDYEVKNIESYDKNSLVIISIIDKNEAQKVSNELIDKGYKNITYYDKFINLNPNKNTDLFD